MSPTGPGAHPDSLETGDKIAQPTTIPFGGIRRLAKKLKRTYQIHAYSGREAHDNAYNMLEVQAKFRGEREGQTLAYVRQTRGEVP
jgi:hypothetical protein